MITATGEGTATVVVCANDEIYRQCDFTVSSDDDNASPLSASEVTTIPYIGADVTKSNNQKLNEIGINAERLISHKNYYIIPLCILGTTGIVTLCIIALKAFAEHIRKRRSEAADDTGIEG